MTRSSVRQGRTPRVADLYLRLLFIHTLYFKSDKMVYLAKSVFVNNINFTRDHMHAIDTNDYLHF